MIIKTQNMPMQRVSQKKKLVPLMVLSFFLFERYNGNVTKNSIGMATPQAIGEIFRKLFLLGDLYIPDSQASANVETPIEIQNAQKYVFFGKNENRKSQNTRPTA